ncbi:MAG TPA: diguanylate cyclase [Candidatus Limnocylindria bacterium]|nr:diguanylate cyclase [Candidatus Limnocylindria bacterium]
MTPRANELSLLMRAADALLNAALDEASVLSHAVELLGEQLGYSMRYLLLYDPEHRELYTGVAAGEGSTEPSVLNYRMTTEHGLTGACARTRAVVNVGDVSSDPRYIAAAAGCRSEMCVPLIARGDLLGVLTVQSPKTDAFSLQDERLLSAFAGLVSLALMHAREHAARRSDIEELQAVNEVARRAATLDRDGTLRTIVEAFQRVTTADSTAVFLWDEETQWLEVATMMFDPRYYPAEYETMVRETKVKLGEGIVGWTAEHREPALIGDAEADRRVAAVPGVPLDRKSAIVVPLVADQRLLGVIRAVKIGVDSFTADHYRFAQTLANQASLAISAAAAHEAVRRLSVTDELTGVYNGRHFRARLHEEIERARRGGRPLSLLVIDSDSLKEVNDRFGHEAGNRHLVAIAQAVQGHVRTSDVVARFGGDEFLVLQPDATPEAAALVAERIRVAVAASRIPAGEGAHVIGTVSIGVAGFPRSASDEDSLFRSADAALYDAKRHGKDRVFIAPASA